MITNSVLVLWIIINLADLQRPLIIRLAEVKLDLENNKQSGFARRMATINPIAVIKVFHIICNIVFMSLLAVGQLEGGLLRLISNYFATVKINGRDIFYLH